MTVGVKDAPSLLMVTTNDRTEAATSTGPLGSGLRSAARWPANEEN
jgi:hypothetical protein